MPALYVSIVSLVTLLFEYIDRVFPDPLQAFADPYGGGIRFGFPGALQYVGYGVGALVLATVAAGFAIMGTPGDMRLLRFDDQKVADLQNVQWQVVAYWQRTERVPQALAELHDPLAGFVIPADPQTGAPHRYETTGVFSFRLCADFNRESRARPVAFLPDDTWEHGAGEVCFDQTIDPGRYPPFPRER